MHEISSPVRIGLTVASTLVHRCANFTDQIAAGPVRRSLLAEFADSCRDAANQLVANLQRAAELNHSFKQVAVDRSHADRRTFDLKLVTEQIVASVWPGLRRICKCSDDVRCCGSPQRDFRVSLTKM